MNEIEMFATRDRDELLKRFGCPADRPADILLELLEKLRILRDDLSGDESCGGVEVVDQAIQVMIWQRFDLCSPAFGIN